MQVAISTIGTYHYVDLATELVRMGVRVLLFSGYPRYKLEKRYKINVSGLTVKTFSYINLIYLAKGRLGLTGGFWERKLSWIAHKSFDRYVSCNLPNDYLFIGQSRLSLRSGIAAQARGNAYICDVGSSHIRTQRRLLTDEFARRGLQYDLLEQRVVHWEEREYQTANRVSVISTFAKHSFEQEGIPANKLFLNPLGVNLAAFRPDGSRKDDGVFRILFVGGVNHRKGVAYLLEAARALQGKRELVLAGTPNPEFANAGSSVEGELEIRFLGHQPQSTLRVLMTSADVLVLPSIEDGFGMVLLQSLACGCPIVASRNSGGPDVVDEGKTGLIFEAGNVVALTRCLQEVAGWRNRPGLRVACRESALQRGGSSGWSSYATRYLDMLKNLAEVKS